MARAAQCAPALIGDSNLPGRPWRDLLTSDKTIGQPAMNRRCVHAQNVGCFANRNELPSGWLGGWLKARDVAVSSQAADLIGGEAFAGSGLAVLTIQDSGDDFVRIKSGQTPEQRDRIFVGVRSHRLESRNRDIEYGNRTAAPAQHQMRVTFGSFEIQDHFFQQRSQEFLAIAIRNGRRSPNLTNIGAEHLNAFELLGTHRIGPLLLAAAQFCFGGGQIA